MFRVRDQGLRVWGCGWDICGLRFYNHAKGFARFSGEKMLGVPVFLRSCSHCFRRTEAIRMGVLLAITQRDVV